jgi:hypothetical protein
MQVSRSSRGARLERIGSANCSVGSGYQGNQARSAELAGELRAVFTTSSFKFGLKGALLEI